MAFPTWLDVTTTSGGNTDATSVAVNMPATVASGDLLVMIVSCDGRHTFYIDDELWLPLAHIRVQGNSADGVIFVRNAVGNEDGTTVTVTLADGSEQFAAQVHRIQAGTWSGNLGGVVWASQTTNSATPDPVALTPYWGAADTLWIAFYVANEDSDASVYPASYSNGTYTESGANVGFSSSLGSATRTVNTTSENPGTFTIAAAQDWGAGVIAIAPLEQSLQLGGPLVQSITHTAFGSDATSHLVNMPATVANGDLLLMQFANDGTATVTVPPNWVQLDSTADGASQVRQTLLAKCADGTEDGTTVDVVTSTTEQGDALVIRIAAFTWQQDLTARGLEVGTAASATSTLPDPPNNAPTWATTNTLWFAMIGHDATSGLQDTASNTFSFPRDSRSSAAAGNCGLCLFGVNSSVASLNPGVCLISASEDWVAQTVAIRPGPPAFAPVDKSSHLVYLRKNI